MKLTLDELQELQDALNDIVGYETDNSCGNPECCGGPWYEKSEFIDGLKVLRKYGLEYEG